MSMWTIVQYFFVTLGVIFFALILFVAYVWYSDMWNVRTYSSFITASPAAIQPASESGSAEQQEALEAAGIDAGVFANLSTEQEQCFTDRLGQDRVNEIISGAMPTLAEITAGSECL